MDKHATPAMIRAELATVMPIPHSFRGRRRCFSVPDRLDATLMPKAEPHPASHALARLVALLGCGEEAACLSFDRLQALVPAQRFALARVAADERIHDALLGGLSASLPNARPPARALSAMRSLHASLGRGSLAEQCAGIAALDSAVCLLLSHLLARCAMVRPIGEARAVLQRIRHDEARHVVVTRTIAMQADAQPVLLKMAERARYDLATALTHAADDLEAVGVDAGVALAAIAKVPRGLFPA